MDQISDVYEQSLNELEKADKVGNILEGVITTVMSAGISFIVGKGCKKIYEPQNLGEKILMYVGSAAIGTALGQCAGQAVHEVTHPLEQRKKQKLLNETIVLAQKQIELSQATIDVANAAHDEANMLLQAIYIPDDVPDNGLTMDDIKKSVDISVEENKDGE